MGMYCDIRRDLLRGWLAYLQVDERLLYKCYQEAQGIAFIKIIHLNKPPYENMFPFLNTKVSYL